MKRKNKTSELQRRRLKAGRLLLKGVTQAEVARRVGVSRPSVLPQKFVAYYLLALRVSYDLEKRDGDRSPEGAVDLG
jgi:hypothetical protein